MTVAIPTPNTAAALRRDTPLSTAPTTRSRKSREYGRAMHAGPLPSMQLESQFRAWRNPLSRLDQAGYRSSLRFLLPLRRLARLSLLYEVGTGPPHDRVRRPVLRSLWRTA